MNLSWIRGSLLAGLAIVTLLVWAVLIWIALHISTVALDTLDMIVELAAISP